jgi:hypothetical protein
MYKRLAILSCCALFAFALGHWLAPAARPSALASPSDTPTADSRVVETAALPPPERAGRVPFAELYQSLRASSAGAQAAYLGSLQSLPNGPDRRAAMTEFFQCMASISPQVAANLVQLVGKDDRVRAAIAVMAATASPDTPILVKMLLDLPPDTEPDWRTEQIRGQMFFWATMDPTGAARFVDEHQSTDPELAAGPILQALAATDPAMAARWMDEHQLTREPMAVSNYIAGLYEHDPALARHYVIEHASEEAVVPELENVARRTFISSAEKAAEFIQDLPTPQARTAALDGITETNIELFADRNTSATALYAGMAAWVTKFPPGEWPPAMSDLLGRWQQLDPAASMSWMAQLPSDTRPAVAQQVANASSDESLRQLIAAAPQQFRRDLLAAVAGMLPPDIEARQARIAELQLPPEDAATLGNTTP